MNTYRIHAYIDGHSFEVDLRAYDYEGATAVFRALFPGADFQYAEYLER